MLHTKYEDHQLIGSGDDIFKGFTIYGHGSYIDQVTWMI